MMRRRAVAVLFVLSFALGAHGDGDPAKAPAGAPQRDPAQEQAFQDKAAEDALPLVRSASVADAMAGLERLSKVRSAKVTSAVIDAVLARREPHVAAFAGSALSLCDPDGAIKDLKERAGG